MIVRAVALLVTLFILVGCSTISETRNKEKASSYNLPTTYDYQLLDRDYQPISLNGLLASLQGNNVVFIGEYHGNHASHLLEMNVLSGLHQLNNASTILSMEMFNRDQQAILDDYIESAIGERFLIQEAPTWKNYKASYRPLVEYAKENSIAVIAANAPSNIVRCIGRQGESYIDKLNTKEKLQIAENPFADVPGYKDKFMEAMAGAKHMPKESVRNSYLAQLTRDNTMAQSIAKAHQQSPNSIIVHVNGSFHSEGYLGTAGALKRLNPNLKIKVITPVHVGKLNDVAPREADDFYYLINAQPQEFVNDAYKKKVHGEMFKGAMGKAKSCK